MKGKWKNLVEDLATSLFAITIWSAIAYGIVYFFPSASWVWYIVILSAVFSIAGVLTDLTLRKIVEKLIQGKPRTTDDDQ